MQLDGTAKSRNSGNFQFNGYSLQKIGGRENKFYAANGMAATLPPTARLSFWPDMSDFIV